MQSLAADALRPDVQGPLLDGLECKRYLPVTSTPCLRVVQLNQSFRSNDRFEAVISVMQHLET